MFKQELIAEVAAQTNVSKANVSAILDAFIETITESVVNGDDVKIAGFGTFKQVTRAARKGRNPKTGEVVSIAARKVPVFRAGTKFKAAVNV